MALNRVALCVFVALIGESLSSRRSDPQCGGHGIFDGEWDECLCEEGYMGDLCEECARDFAGHPDCKRIPKGGEDAYGWPQLCPEVANLRAESPSFVVRLGELYPARQVLDRTRALVDLRKNSSTQSNTSDCAAGSAKGPWRLKVDLAAPGGKGPKAYQKHHRVILVFGEDWPVALPTIRFPGKITSGYTVDSDTSASTKLHNSEPNGLLLRRLQELAGGTVTCMWRQTGDCDSTGSKREPVQDRLCDSEVPAGASGFCDCDGDGEKSPSENGYGCDVSPGTCRKVCGAEPKSTTAPGSSKGPPRHTLRSVLEALHRMTRGPLEATDARAWHKHADQFATEVSTNLKYEKFGRRHPQLFDTGGFRDDFMIDADLRALVNATSEEPSADSARRRLLASGLIQEVIKDQVYSFRVLRPEFMKILMEEINHFYGSKLPARRPNSMNNYGIILNEIGLEPMIFGLQDAVIQPIAALLFPQEGSELESHHSFTIRYKGNEDTHLDIHTDDSDVTFNVNIDEDYTGAPLVFCGINGAPDHRKFQAEYQHQAGFAVMHSGRHRHGAEDITSGERTNLVIWSYSHNFRSSTANSNRRDRETAPPDPRCVSYTHDRDFEQFRAWPTGKKDQFRGRGWCPPRGSEYAGFMPDVKDSDLPRASAAQGGAGGQ